MYTFARTSPKDNESRRNILSILILTNIVTDERTPWKLQYYYYYVIIISGKRRCYYNQFAGCGAHIIITRNINTLDEKHHAILVLLLGIYFYFVSRIFQPCPRIYHLLLLFAQRRGEQRTREQHYNITRIKPKTRKIPIYSRRTHTGLYVRCIIIHKYHIFFRWHDPRMFFDNHTARRNTAVRQQVRY